MPWALSDTRTVQAEFDRCTATMERVERSLRRFDDALERMKQNIGNHVPGKREEWSGEMTALENRIEYFRNRFERVRGQADKIRDDLKNLTGPACQSCVSSGVELYCRNSESLLTDLEEYLNKASDLEARMQGRSFSASGRGSGEQRNIQARKILQKTEQHSLAESGTLSVFSDTGSTQEVSAVPDSFTTRLPGVSGIPVDKSTSVLTEVFPQETPVESKSGIPIQVEGKKQPWHISTGVDYYHLEDVDTATMTSEELRDYKRLTETPFSVWTRIKTEIKPVTIINDVAPEFYLSENKTRLKIPLRTKLFKQVLRLESILKAEKWFSADASGRTPFKPFYGQPSDMGGLALTAIPGNASQADTRFIWSLPVAVDWQHYRINRPDYESFVDTRITPTLEIRGAASSLSALITAEAGYENYYSGNVDSLDVMRMLVRGETSLHTGKGRMAMTAAWMGDRYARAATLNDVDRLEGSLRSEALINSWMSPRLNMRYIYERETYGPRPEQAAFAVDGTELTVFPEVSFAVTDFFRLSPCILWENRGAEADGPVDRFFLWEARSAWETGIRFGFTLPFLDASWRAVYRAEDINKDFEEYTGDSRSFKGATEVNTAIFGFLTVSFSIDYQFRIYAPYGSSARMSENLTVAGSVSAEL